MATPKPKKISVLAFNVDFGDCFLVRFSYAPNIGDRHVLIDFGATRARKEKLRDIAAAIAGECGGKLDMLVATHRHKDHISGFAHDKEGDSGDIIRALKPSVVMQPWTEDPDVPANATGPRKGMRAFTKSLHAMDAFAASVKNFADTMKDKKDWARYGFTAQERDYLAFAGENNIANASAVRNIMEMGKAGKHLFLHADMEPDISSVLPGVKLFVLGPPTPEQHKKVRKQNPRNDEQYWLRRAADLPSMVSSGGIERQAEQALFEPATPNESLDELSPNHRWIARRVAKLRKDMLLPIVRALDNAMNNTSLILLFQVGEKSFLFPGDAQWENWEYALVAAPKKDTYRKMLSQVDLYKVGHHGSLNATPKLLWELFARKGKAGVPNRLRSVMSTKHGIHGESPETAVPRSTLVRELEKHSDHVSTEDLPSDKAFAQIDIVI
jgi:hypothetical protein